jgi:hypothetical protein
MTILREKLIGQVASELTSLPEEDIPLVVEFVDYLKYRRRKKSLPQRSGAEIREEAKERARLLDQVPREEIVRRFEELGEQIRQDAILRGVAVDGDWTDD